MRRTLLLAGVLSILVSSSGNSEPTTSTGAAAPASITAGLSGKVIRVLDGDTIEVLKVDASGKRPLRIRMTGIDAPEKSQPFGEKCREALASLVAGKTVRVDVRGTDRYSRQLGVILVPKASASPTQRPPETDANLAQISSGCAWHYKQFQKQQRSEERRAYSEAEARARAARVGLWRDPSPEAPWEYRRKSRGSRRKVRLS